MSWAGFLRLLGIATTASHRYPKGNYLKNIHEKEVTIYSTMQPMHRLAYDHETENIYILNLASIRYNKDNIHTVLVMHKTYIINEYKILIKPKNGRASTDNPRQKILCINKSSYKVVPCEIKGDDKGYIKDWKVHASTTGFKIRDANSEWCMMRENSMGIITLQACKNSNLEERFDMMEIKDDPYKRMYLKPEEEIAYTLSELDPAARLPTWMINGLAGTSVDNNISHHHSTGMNNGNWDGYGKSPYCSSPWGCPWNNPQWSGPGGVNMQMNVCMQQCAARMGIPVGINPVGANPNAGWGVSGMNTSAAATYPWYPGSAGNNINNGNMPGGYPNISGENINNIMCMKQCVNNTGGIGFPGSENHPAWGNNLENHPINNPGNYPGNYPGKPHPGNINRYPGMNNAITYPTIGGSTVYPNSNMMHNETMDLFAFKQNMKKMKGIIKSISQICKDNKVNSLCMKKIRKKYRTRRKSRPFDESDEDYYYPRKKKRRGSKRYIDDKHYVSKKRHRKTPVYYEEEYYTDIDGYPNIDYHGGGHRRKPIYHPVYGTVYPAPNNY